MRINLFLSDCHQAVSQHSSRHSLLKIRPFSTCSKWFSHTVFFYNVHRSSEISYLLLSAKCSGWPGCEPLLSWLGALYSHSHQKAYKSRPGPGDLAVFLGVGMDLKIWVAPTGAYRNCLRQLYFKSKWRGIGYSFQLAITAPLYSITGYCIATAQSWSLGQPTQSMR